jgi:hypothetical protein
MRIDLSPRAGRGEEGAADSAAYALALPCARRYKTSR